MEKTFNSIEEAYADIIQNLGVALQKSLEEARTMAYEYIITNWYGKYPKNNKHTYDRLHLMTDSLRVKMELKGNELVGYLYIKEDMHPASNSWNENPVTFEYLYDWFVSQYGEKDILEYTQEELDSLKTFFNIIQNTLKKAGYDFS